MTGRRARAFLVVLLIVSAVACGSKGPPLAPLVNVPARVDDLSARRVGATVHLAFTIPAANENGTTPADLARVEVYGFESRPPAARGAAAGPSERELEPLQVLDVRPPPRDAEPPTASPAGSVPPDERPAQGSRIAIVHALDPDWLAASTWSPPGTPATSDEHVAPAPTLPPSSLSLAAAGPPSLELSVVGVSRNGRSGPMSRGVAVPLGPAPPPPSQPALTYTEEAVSIAWTPPFGAPQPFQQPAEEGMLASTSLVPASAPFTYNVYEVPPGAEADPAASPVNPSAVEGVSFEDPRVTLGTERCYAVRTVQQWGAALAAESEASPVSCVTLVDVFPPAAPTGLAAVGAEGAVSLIWERNREPDLAGYLVLRGEAAGDTLQPLTPQPVVETTYRDTTATPGVRYLYAVVAVDRASPPNVSAESNHVEEAAR